MIKINAGIRTIQATAHCGSVISLRFPTSLALVASNANVPSAFAVTTTAQTFECPKVFEDAKQWNSVKGSDTKRAIELKDKGLTNIQVAMKLNMSESKVAVTMKRVRTKITKILDWTV